MKQVGMKRAVGLVVGVGMLMLTGCSSKEPKPMQQPTPDQVRGHADRGFDNLKKEEKDRGTQTNAPY
jgi:outer membrane biogenesis lipoprotein LolB